MSKSSTRPYRSGRRRPGSRLRTRRRRLRHAFSKEVSDANQYRARGWTRHLQHSGRVNDAGVAEAAQTAFASLIQNTAARAMIPIIMGVLFVFLGFALAALGPIRDSVTAEPPAHPKRRRKKSFRRATASTQTKPLTIVPKEREHG